MGQIIYNQRVARGVLEVTTPLQWRHNGSVGVSNHQPLDCLLSRLFRRGSKKTPKLCVTGLCSGNSPVTGEFPAQMASNAENVSIRWRHHTNLTHWGRMAHISVIELGHHWLCNGLSSSRSQGITWTNNDLWWPRATLLVLTGLRNVTHCIILYRLTLSWIDTINPRNTCLWLLATPVAVGLHTIIEEYYLCAKREMEIHIH